MFKVHSVDWGLALAARHGRLDVIKYLVEHGADIRADGDWPLKISAYWGHLDVIKYLVEQGANVHNKDNYALMWSAYGGHLDLEVVKYLKEQLKNV